jgi:hypothetical protein
MEANEFFDDGDLSEGIDYADPATRQTSRSSSS